VQAPLGCFTPTARDVADLVAFLRTLTDAGVEGHDGKPVRRSARRLP
jgi:hypothetical protein